MINMQVLKLSQVCKYIRLKFISDEYLKNIYIKCKISQINYKYGNYYLRLYEDNIVISGVFFSSSCINSNNIKVLNDLSIDEEVIVYGNIDVYLRRGYYQIVIQDIISCDKTKIEEFEIIKQKLMVKGILDESNKKLIPKFPCKISIVTSSNSAAFYDVIVNIRNRYPYVDLKIHSCIVQGIHAEKDIINKLKQADLVGSDLIILARGGGSKDELSVFNSEKIAYCIFELKTPIVTGIGHEVDITIADLVSDKRCSTPTSTIVDILPHYNDINNIFISHIQTIIRVINDKILYYEERLNELAALLKNLCEVKYSQTEKKLVDSEHILKNISVISNLKRGYTFIYSNNDIVDIESIKVNDIIYIIGKNKKIKCEVKEVLNDEFGKKYFENRRKN